MIQRGRWVARGHRLRSGAVVATDLGTLAVWHSAPGHAWSALRRGTAGVDSLAADLAAAALWLVALWVAAALAAVALSSASGLTGRGAEFVARVIVPATLRRVIAGLTGLGVVLAPVAASATTVGGPTPAPAPTSSSAGVSAPHTIPAPTWPTTAGTPTHRHPDRHVPGGSSGAHVTVAPGDCLWLIAARRLGPTATDEQIAAAWPVLYRTNRDVIGDDPSLIRPGQALLLPGTQHVGGSAADHDTKEPPR